MPPSTRSSLGVLVAAPLLLPLVALPDAAAVAPCEVAPCEVALRYRSADIELAGALLLPAGSGPFPAAILLQGSGSSDRRNPWARMVAGGLTERGVAVLLTDKRGSGESGGDWRQVGFDALAGDALAGIAALRERSEIDADRIGLLGLSQGAMVAPFAAVDPRIAFVVAVSGAATTPAEQVRHELANTFRAAGHPPAEVEAGLRLQDLAADFVRGGRWQPYADALAAAEGGVARIAAGFPQARDSWVWSWWRRVGDLDLAAAWSRVEVPALVVYGGRDELDNVPVSESVRRLNQALSGNAAAEIVVYPASGHTIEEPGVEPARLRAELLDRIGRFVHGKRPSSSSSPPTSESPPPTATRR
jgi:hypothetical protein